MSFQAGQSLNMFCPECGKRQETTFRYATLVFVNGAVRENVLQAFCNQCKTPVAMAPHPTSD